MILSSVPESVGGVKTSFRRNIRPLIETKMPLSNQVSRITWGRTSLRQKYHAIRIISEFWSTSLYRITSPLVIGEFGGSISFVQTELRIPRRSPFPKLGVLIQKGLSTLPLIIGENEDISTFCILKQSQNIWTADQRAFRELVIHTLVNVDRWAKHFLNEVLKQILILIWKAIVHATQRKLLLVASVSARVRRENWDESKKEPFLLPSLQLSRNNSIGNHCYAGYRERILMMLVNCWRALSNSILPFMLVIDNFFWLYKPVCVFRKL